MNAQPLRKSKYHNVKTIVDGIAFDSAHESRRYSELKLLQRAGEITELAIQPRFDLSVNGQKIASYIADFSFRDKAGSFVVEDAKGMRTPVYALKAKLMRAIHGIEVVEV